MPPSMDERALFGHSAEDNKFVTRANDAILLKLVSNCEDALTDDRTFHPEFTHQVFGDSEKIYGYEDLKIQLHYTAGSLRTLFHVSHGNAATEADGAKPDDVEGPIKDYLVHDYTTNPDEFIRYLETEGDFRPPGEMVHRYTRPELGSDACFEIYKASTHTRGLREYHERMQTFVIWFIDGSSYIDVDDPKWRFYMLYADPKWRLLMFKKENVGGQDRYAFGGYCTTYEFYAYPENIRPRISQFLVLPPFQRQGHGVEILHAIYRDYGAQSLVVDITAEDPSPGFAQLRDVVELSMCLKHLGGKEAVDPVAGLGKDTVGRLQGTLKINKRQLRRIEEIIVLHALDRTDAEQYKAFRVKVKKRLRQMYQDEMEALKEDKGEQLKLLQQAYQDLEAYYSDVYNRALAMH